MLAGFASCVWIAAWTAIAAFFGRRRAGGREVPQRVRSHDQGGVMLAGFASCVWIAAWTAIAAFFAVGTANGIVKLRRELRRK